VDTIDQEAQALAVAESTPGLVKHRKHVKGHPLFTPQEALRLREAAARRGLPVNRYISVVVMAAVMDSVGGGR
jgi:hypothetical protein